MNVIICQKMSGKKYWLKNLPSKCAFPKKLQKHKAETAELLANSNLDVVKSIWWKFKKKKNANLHNAWTITSKK